MKTTLVIMAAGIGSRFGEGIKQLEPVGLHDEMIMDYSIHDAIEAGFNKIILIIRKEIEDEFKERIGNRIKQVCDRLNVEMQYCFQNLNDVPNGTRIPSDRVKPWGTGQAVLAAKALIREPFAVINADDYYGKEAFCIMHTWLVEEHEKNAIAMAGFILENTLSDHGGVTRGVCKVSEDCSHVIEINETKNIMKTGNGVEADGKKLDPKSYVSMNFWGFPTKNDMTPEYLNKLETDFAVFFRDTLPNNPLKEEYLLPIHIGNLLEQNQCSVTVLETKDKWFGVTYKEDKSVAVNSFRQLIEKGIYSKDLYSDLF